MSTRRAGPSAARTQVLPADSTATTSARRGKAAILTLGCARNDVDSDELAGSLTADGWHVVGAHSADAPDIADADVVVVNTCGFVEAAKKDSIDAVLAAAGGSAKVVAVGCLAERYGQELAAQLPEADVVAGFDRYGDIAAVLQAAVDGEPVAAHVPRDRRRLLPVSPSARSASAVAVPGHGWLPGRRRRLAGGPTAALKLASGCDRRCSFCAIPAFRGAFVSRPPEEVLAEAQWLADQGVRELLLVSENSTSYGKDRGDVAALDRLLPQLAAVPGVSRVRVAYLQPAEVRPGLLEVIAGTPGVAPYFDLSFQHAAPDLLRRMRRFGSPESFLRLVDTIRSLAPPAGIRSNVIVGFPGETEADIATLVDFLAAARLDAVGVFGYSAEEGTEAARFPAHHGAAEIARRVDHVTAVVDELMAQRAEDRVGEQLDILIEEVQPRGATATGRAAHQGPDSDGAVTVAGLGRGVAPGDMIVALATGSVGVDLLGRAVDTLVSARP